MNPTVELVLKHKKANMRKSDFLMLEALKSAPQYTHQNFAFGKTVKVNPFIVVDWNSEFG